MDKILSSSKLRYLIVGGVNTIFGYLVGVYTYKYCIDLFNIWIVGLLSNVLAITFSFLMYKCFVFKTKGRWLSEYLKAYLVYGLMAGVGIVMLWFYVGVLNVSIYLAQALVILTTVVLSYIGHARFTFNRKKGCDI